MVNPFFRLQTLAMEKKKHFTLCDFIKTLVEPHVACTYLSGGFYVIIEVSR